MRSIAIWILVAAASLALAPSWLLAQADAENSARADALFAEGRQHLASGDYLRACPLLEQSYSLDPATGSQLALALCHEKAGQLSAALIAYRQVLARSEAEQRTDRARAARGKIEQLEKATASLRVDTAAVANETALQLNLNGKPVTLAQGEGALRVDPGELCLEASAPEKQVWRTCLTTAAGEEHTLTIPALEPVPASAVVATPIEAAPARLNTTPRHALRMDDDSARLAPAEWAGIALLSAGGLGAVTSIGFVLRAAHQRDLGDLHCTDTCTPAGEDARRAEARARDGALISGMVALAAGVAGVVTYVWGRHTHGRRARHASAAPVVAPGLAGLGVAGRF